MLPHDWIIEEIDGGNMGVAEVWSCRTCGACNNHDALSGQPPTSAFYPNGSGLQLTMDCEESQGLIAKSIAVGFRPDLRWDLAKKRKRFFLDTEFLEAGPSQAVHLVSLGLVAEDGRTYYAECADTDLSLANDWVKKNVVPHLKGGAYAKSRAKIREEVVAFVLPDRDRGRGGVEFWGYYSAYDWVVFAQLFGTMVDLPKGMPMFCHDIKQWMEELQVEKRWLPKQEGAEHDALNDAQWNKLAYDFLAKRTMQNMAARR